MTRARASRQMLYRMIGGYWVSQAIYVVVELGIPDILAEGRQTAAELAERTGSHEASLYRLMRALASFGIFAVDGEGRFGLTQVAEQLRSGVADSQRAFALLMGSELYRCWGGLLHSVRTGEEAFRTMFGEGLFEYMEKSPDRGSVYDGAMAATHGRETEPMLGAYDFSRFSKVVDVGGGNGKMLEAILHRCDGTRGVLFDLAAVAERAQKVLSESAVSERLEVVGGDFFAGVPSGGDAYILRHIIHDWGDDEAITILKNCVEAMAAGGRVLVVETLMSSGNEPCLGKWLDLMMMVVGGCERTEEQYRRLFSQAGLELRRVVPTGVEISILEGVRANGV